MDWNDLRYFLAVAEARTLLGAARRLGVNHSTVFRRINQFENAVGVRLFERLTDGYQLTQSGEEMFTHAQRIGEEIDLLQLKLQGKDFLPSGKIRITAPENLANEYLPAYIASFARLYPEIQLELVVGAQSLDLTRREADLAVRATPAPPPHLVGRKVLSVEWAYFAAPSLLEESGRPEKPSELSGCRLIGADGALERVPPYQHLARHFTDEVMMTCSTINAMSAMAEVGFGIALLPDDQVKPTLVRLFPCDPPFQSDIWLLTHPELRKTERIRLLKDHLYRCFREDPRLRDIANL